MDPATFDRSRLSTREDAVLELAISGLTDQQIAAKLRISTSTVNSYWVRIRGKLGSKTRTELVALALKFQAKTEVSELIQRNQAYEREASERRRLEGDVASAELYHCALDSMPEAILVQDQAGRILFTNDLLEQMFGYEGESVVGMATEELIPSDENPNLPSIGTCLAMDVPKRYGLEEVLFARNREGYFFRVVLLLRTAFSTHGPITVCMFRRFGPKEKDAAFRSDAGVAHSPDDSGEEPKSGITFR